MLLTTPFDARERASKEYTHKMNGVVEQKLGSDEATRCGEADGRLAGSMDMRCRHTMSY